MKVTFLSLFLFTGACFATTTYSQETSFSFEVKNETVGSVIRLIEKNSEFIFFYLNDVLDVNRQVNVRVKDQPVDKILDQLFEGTDLTYKISDRQITIVRQEKEIAVPSAPQQTVRRITGTVVDEFGDPVIGANVIEKGTLNGTLTDIDGNFSFTVGSDEFQLEVSYIGYETQLIRAKAGDTVSIVIWEDNQHLDDVVIVGYGVQKKSSLTAAISNLKGDDIAKNPVADISNTFAGRVAGVLSRQEKGEPGYDSAEILIRGKATTGNTKPLIVIDGIQRSNYNQLDPNSIESITVLKDAAAVAPYGLGGANGVILVTTKKGKSGKATISYNGYVGFQNATRMHDMVNSYEYAMLMNEGARNSGMVNMPYTDEEIANYKKTVDGGVSGAHADRYPNSRGVRDIIDQNTPITNHSIEISGGNDNVNYYISLGYLFQQGQFSPTKMKRYNLQSKIDAKVTPTTNVSLSVGGYVQDQNYPAESAWNIIYWTTRTPPTSAIWYSNGTWGNYLGRSAVGHIHHSGYEKNDITQIHTNFEVEQQIPFLKGLSFKGVLSFDPRFKFNKKWRTPILSYNPDFDTDPITYNETYAGETSELSEANNYDKVITMQGYFTYKNTFGLHDISALAVAERREVKQRYNSLSRGGFPVDIDEINFGSTAEGMVGNGGSSSGATQVGFVYRLSYAYAGKYMAEAAGRYDGHYYFAPGSKWGFFPSFSLAWNMGEEDFIKNKVAFLNQLKLRASYGESGNLTQSPFQYLAGYKLTDNDKPSAYLGQATTGVVETKQANRSITWEKAKKFNVGFDALLWDGKLSVTADFFYEMRNNMLMAPNVLVPVEYGVELPDINSGKMSNRGVEVTLGSNLRINKDLNINLQGTLTFAKNKLVEVYEAESTYNNPNRRKTGRPNDTYFGYKALGYFSEEDFDSNGKLKDGIASIRDANVAPGDLRYADLSGPNGVPDGIIDEHDYTVIGRPKNTPQLMFGFSPTIAWKQFDLGFLIQGASCYDSYIWGIAVTPFENLSSVTKLVYDDHWTPENRDARYPRVTIQPLAHNTVNSSHWIRNATYFRLKNIELGYNLPQKWTQKAAMSKVRVYFAGQNLLTWTPFMKEKIDPEAGDTNGIYYYLQSVYSFGLNVTF